MKMIAFLIVGILGILAAVGIATSAGPGCNTGEARGFVAIRSDPAYLVGTIPNKFTGSSDYFNLRYNCTGGSAEVKRVDEGIYDVRFRGLTPKVAVVSAISDEGVSASALPLGNNTVRVALRGPLGNGIAARRDVPFSLVVY